MEIAGLGVIIFISILLSALNPQYFVLFYILVHTKFLGFFYVGALLIQGVSIGMFAINLITLSAGLIKFEDWRQLDKSLYIIFMGIAFFILYGILLPVYKDYSTLQQSIIASKEFWNFSILLYLVAVRKHIDLNLIIKAIIVIGVYLACTLIIFSLIRIGPPLYIESNDGSKYLRVFYPTIISLSLFCIVGVWNTRKLKKPMLYLMLIPINIIGLVLARHSALTICTTMFIFIFFFFGISRKRIIPVLYFVSFSIVIILYTDALYQPIENFYNDIVSGEDKALSTRQIYNKFRWNAIDERPYSGYGFIHKTSKINKKFLGRSDSYRFMETLTVMDSGYVDLLGRFGYLFTTLYLLLLGLVLIKPLLNPKRYDVIDIGIVAFISQYYIVNYTWSVFSFGHGIMPLCIGLYILIFYNKTNNITLKTDPKKLFA